jgi:hypothetical protein
MLTKNYFTGSVQQIGRDLVAIPHFKVYDIYRLIITTTTKDRLKPYQ